MMEVWLATRALIRLVGRTVQAIGICLVAVSVAGLTGSGLSQASGYLSAAVSRIAAALPPPPSPSPTESPSPAPSPSGRPSPPPALTRSRGGPLEFSLNGSLSLGENGTTSTRTDAFGAPVVDATNQASTSVGLFAELRRRTANSTADVRIPLGFTSTGTQLGLAVVTFSTPHYELQYGTQSVNLFGQVPLGQTLRGFALVLPLDSGDMTIFEGPAYGVGEETVHIQGIRARRLFGRDLFELGLVRNAGGSLTGSASTLTVGVAASHGRAGVVGEVALQERNAPDGRIHGIAGQVRFDYGGVATSWTATVRHTPERFLAYGSGELYGDNMVDLGFRTSSGRGGNLAADVAYESSVLFGSVAKTRRSFLSYGGAAGRTNYQLSFQEARQGGDQAALWNGTAALQIGIPIARGFALVGAQLGRTTNQGGYATGSSSLGFQLQRQFGPFAAQFSEQEQRQSNAVVGVSRLRTTTFGTTRQWGRTGFGYNYVVTRTLSSVSDAIQRSPQFTLTRQISPALSVQTTFGTQSLDDRLNPLNSGRSRIFAISINAPFAYGNGLVQGRIDPNLPAIITGRVLNDLGDNIAVAGLAAGGVSNITVVLDGKEAQRTDLDGNFQFSFVKPGQHQLRLETASLPRGLTADQPVVTLNVEGGQSAQLYFRVGNFGGVTGHVFGRDSNGAQMPLSNVLLRVDGGAYSQTDNQGSYGFGRLNPGPHVVSIVDTSVPAFASFSKDQSQQRVSVRDGQLSTLDFIAQPLGSIAGHVLYAHNSLGYTGGVANAYVVAEPGEHAAITNDDGSFIIDNLPAGPYAVSVDPETIPDGVAAEGDPLAITLTGTDNYNGAEFLVGEKQKSVVFSFMGGGASAATLHRDDARLPPLGTTSVAYAAPPSVKDAVVTVFGKPVVLAYDAKRSVWRGTIAVPAGTKAGTYDAVATATGISASATAQLTVDPKMSIAILQLTPPNVAVGQYAAVRARFLVDVRAGDKIEWSDGTVTTLGRPVAGRVFTFSLRISLRPLYGVLLTSHARLPIRLL